MSTTNFLNLLGADKPKLKNFFRAEESLLSELEYCESKINSITTPYTAIDIALLTIYRNHFKNITNLLDKLQTFKHDSNNCV